MVRHTRSVRSRREGELDVSNLTRRVLLLDHGAELLAAPLGELLTRLRRRLETLEELVHVELLDQETPLVKDRLAFEGYRVPNGNGVSECILDSAMPIAFDIDRERPRTIKSERRHQLLQ